MDVVKKLKWLFRLFFFFFATRHSTWPNDDQFFVSIRFNCNLFLYLLPNICEYRSSVVRCVF